MKPEDVALGAFLADFEGLAKAAGGSFIRMKESFAWPGGDGVLKLIETLPNPSGREGKCILAANRLLCKNRQGKSAGITRLQSPFDPAKHLPWLRRSEMADYSKAELFHPTANSQHGKDELPDAWKGLLAAIDDLTASSGSYGIRLETWIEAFKEYALRLPGELTLFNEKPLPKTPLFLLARTRGALAHILAQSQMDESGLEELCRPGSNQPSPFSLILGDLSGLQAFLYGGATKRAVRALKGRSFYLQHIMENMALKVREHLGLTPFAEVFCGGGRFCLIGAKGKDVSAIQ
ncbi:MAG: hypothetical protein QMD09_05990, partial [Desulfatibacillaceae bacterium]|nr:hypothetical protein [Desulfatibacillaceae bacterium]